MNRLWVLPVLLMMFCSGAFGADNRHELRKKIDASNIVAMVNDLELDARQVAAFLAVAREVVRLGEGYEQQVSQANRQVLGHIRTKSRALAEGTEVAERTAQALADHETRAKALRAEHYRAANVQIRSLRAAMRPAQDGLVDWTMPADISGAGATDEERIEIIMALRRETEMAMNLLTSVRSMPPADFITLRISRLNEWLRQYFHPDSPEFAEGRDWLIQLTDEARMIPQEAWGEELPLMTAELMLHFGLLHDSAGAPAPNAIYGWWDLYTYLVDPQSVEVLEAVLQNRAG